MFILKLLRYITGYVRFQARGVFFEKFLTICAQQGIRVFEPSRKDEIMTGYVLAKDYKRLKKPSRKTGLTLKITKKSGIPFFISRYKRRLGVVAGIILFLSALTILSNFVWSIEIVGIQTIDKQEVISSLEDLGFKVGCYIPSIDVRRLEQQFLLENDEVAWIGININSSVAEIQIHERVKSPEFTVDNDKACDVVASQTGLIKYMEVYDGQPQVSVGDVVLEGQLLISGILEDAKGNVTLKHARAKILALVWEDVVIEVNMSHRYRVDTGEKKTLNTLVFLGARIPLYLSDKVDFEYYEETSATGLSIFGFELPISVQKRVLIGYEEQTEELTEESAKKQAFEKLDLYIQENLPDAYVESRDANERIEDGRYILTVNLKIKKDIAKEKEILFDKKTGP